MSETSALERFCVLLGVGVAVLGTAAWTDAFLIEFFGGLAVFCVGVPFALWLFRREREAEASVERQRRGSELLAIAAAGATEASRVWRMAEAAVVWLEEGDRPSAPIARIHGFWLDTLGERYFQLTADDGPLHDLRQAHSALAEAVGHLDASESPPPAGNHSTLRHDAETAARSARIWANRARDSFKEAKLGW